jgi:flagellar biosynthesis/type III secretory pathway protein FliH
VKLDLDRCREHVRAAAAPVYRGRVDIVSGVRRGDSVVVHLCPDDLERLQDVSFRAGTQLVADGELGRGEVHVTTPHGVLVRDIDIALDGVLERIRADLS